MTAAFILGFVCGILAVGGGCILNAWMRTKDIEERRVGE